MTPSHDTQNLAVVETLSPAEQAALRQRLTGPWGSDEEWTLLLQRIPVDWEALAREHQAVRRKRHLRRAGDLLRLVLAYSVLDWPFRLVAAWAAILGLAELSDTAVRKRIRQARAWVGALIGAWLQWRLRAIAESAVTAGRAASAVNVEVVDASVISAPGSTGSDWRLHAHLALSPACLRAVTVTDAHGGETFLRYPVQAGAIVLADRGYAHRNGLGGLEARQAHFVVRTNVSNLPLEQAGEQPFEFTPWLQAATETSTAEHPAERCAWVTTPQGCVAVRAIACPLAPAAADAAVRRARQASRKKGHTPRADTLLAARFVILVTDLPAETWPAVSVLALYRLRWQVELLFKRLKSILHLDQLRAKDPEVAQVYLLGKLLALCLQEDWGRLGSAADPLSQWATNAQRPLSLWRWTQLHGEGLGHAVRGPLSFARILAVLPQLARYLCDSPRKRLQQLALARSLSERFGLPVMPPAPPGPRAEAV